jgi:hypothetical protein
MCLKAATHSKQWIMMLNAIAATDIKMQQPKATKKFRNLVYAMHSKCIASSRCWVLTNRPAGSTLTHIDHHTPAHTSTCDRVCYLCKP